MKKTKRKTKMKKKKKGWQVNREGLREKGGFYGLWLYKKIDLEKFFEHF